MLATFVIGLREGLEAALIVGIIAAFLKKNGKPLLPMWLGVIAAIVLSVAIGVALEVVQQSLDQTAQEAMETVIGGLAVVFVTGMVLWMTTHARGMKRELEASAGAAIGDGSSGALVLMAFLAVLKEGIETAIFLLATFNSAASPTSAAVGAVLGIVIACGIGYGLYTGGVRINLSRFFRWTGVFLILVAAGLVLQALHTAHAAGWVNGGQQATVDLSWLAPYGTVRSALVTGVLGIPPDPRLIEVVGYLAYLVPMLALVYWPIRHRPSAARAQRLRLVLGATLVAAAAVLALLVHPPAPADPGRADLVDPTSGSSIGSAALSGDRLTYDVGSGEQVATLTGGRAEMHGGVDATRYDLPAPDVGDAPASLTLADLTTLSGGRVPVGIDVRRNPGPYDATWAERGSAAVWVADGVLLDTASDLSTVVTLSGGGLATSRTVTVSGTPDSASATWAADASFVQRTSEDLGGLPARRDEARLWGRLLPLALVLAAGGVLLAWWRRRPTTADDPVSAPEAATTAVTSHPAPTDPATRPDPSRGPPEPTHENPKETTHAHND